MKKITVLIILYVFILLGCNNDYEQEFITSFSFLKDNNTELSTDVYGEIDDSEITLIVPSNTDLTSMVATFETNAETIAIRDTLEYQVSSETKNDFSSSSLRYILSPVNITETSVESAGFYEVKAGWLIDSNSFNDSQIYSIIASEVGKDPFYSYDLFSRGLNLGDSISDLTGLDCLGRGLYGLYIFFDNSSAISLEPISSMKNLCDLSLYSAISLSDLQLLSNLTNLESLIIDVCNISDISFISGLTNLNYLSLRYNSISDISFLYTLTKIEYLNLYGNNITDITSLKNTTSIKELSLNTNNVSDISTLSTLTNLISLDIGRTNVSDLSFLSSIITLDELYIDNINSLNLSQISGLTNLKVLSAGSNNIIYIDELASLTNLTELDLSVNDITVITAISSLKNLTELVIVSNNITDITPLKDLMNLKKLYIYNNGMDIRVGTDNKDVVDTLINRGCYVSYETGNIIN